MNLKELMGRVKFVDVIEELNKNYEDIVEEAYKSAWDYLKSLKPEKDDDFVLTLREVGEIYAYTDLEDDDISDVYTYISVGAVEISTDTSWSICSMWEKILLIDIKVEEDGKLHLSHNFENKIECETFNFPVKEMNEAEIVAHILWELTFYGFSPNSCDDELGVIANYDYGLGDEDE